MAAAGGSAASSGEAPSPAQQQQAEGSLLAELFAGQQESGSQEVSLRFLMPNQDAGVLLGVRGATRGS